MIGTSLGILYLARKEKLHVAADPRLCRLLRAVRPVLRPARQFREPGTVGRADQRALGGPLRRNRRAYGAVLGPPRHPSQLYEAGLEGLVLFAILWFMFWRTKARYQPGKLVGAFIFFYGIFRFGIEFIREPDAPADRVRRRRPACTWASG